MLTWCSKIVHIVGHRSFALAVIFALDHCRLILVMHQCKHTTLLQVAGDKGLVLYDFGRFEQVIRDLPNPNAQYPQLVHFVGGRRKDAALKQLFPHNNIRRSRPRSIANLHIDTSSIDADSPLLFLDSNPFVGITPVPKHANCHPLIQHPLTWYRHLNFTVNDILHARLLFLFSDVVCVFVDDFPSLEDSALQLIRWARIGSASSLASHVRPRVIIVITDSCVPPESAERCIESFCHSVYEGCQDGLDDTFGSIEILPLGSSQPSQLKKVIGNQTMNMSNVRQHYNVRFSATHLGAFFKQAVAHLGKSVEAPFNFLSVARAGNPVDDDLLHHLTNFLRLAQKSKIASRDLTLYISSAFLMDAYPPEMHG